MKWGNIGVPRGIARIGLWRYFQDMIQFSGMVGRKRRVRKRCETHNGVLYMTLYIVKGE